MNNFCFDSNLYQELIPYSCLAHELVTKFIEVPKQFYEPTHGERNDDEFERVEKMRKKNKNGRSGILSSDSCLRSERLSGGGFLDGNGETMGDSYLKQEGGSKVVKEFIESAKASSNGFGFIELTEE